MAQGVKRRRIHGIAIETSGYGIAENNPTFAIPALSLEYNPQITQANNTAMLGSTYEVNDVINDNKMTNFTMTIKIHEDLLPLLFSQAFTILSTTVSGETSVYEHTLTYSNTNEGNSFTLFVEDPDRGSEVVAGAKFNTINFETVRGDYLQCTIEGMGKFPETWSGSTSLNYIQEFASTQLSMQYVPEGSGFSGAGNESVVNATLNHTFNLSGEEDNFDLGSANLARLYTQSPVFNQNVTARYGDRTFRDQWENQEYRATRFTLVDSNRVVSGSTANTNPEARFIYPSERVTNWQEQGDANTILKQQFDLQAIDKIGIADAPMKMTVVNSISGYAITP